MKNTSTANLETQKFKRTVIIISIILVLLLAFIITMVVTSLKDKNVDETPGVPQIVDLTQLPEITTLFGGGEVLTVGSETTTAGSNSPAPTPGPAATTAQQQQTAPKDPSSWSRSEILANLTNAINNTKAYTGSLSVHHTEQFSANITRITGGSLVESVANSLIGSVVKPTDETLNYSGGRAVNSEGETVPILLPKSGAFRLSESGIAAASAQASGSSTIVNIKLVPESVGLNDIPTHNSSAIGYLDIGSLDLSLFTITAATITYQGSTIQAVILPNGYISSVTYTMPMNVNGAGNAKLISGEVVFDGQEVEVWELRW